MTFQEEELQQGGKTERNVLEIWEKSYEITVIRITELKISLIII